MFIKVINREIKELSMIAIPLIVQNIACMLIGLVDQIFIGHISTEAYGAIGIAVSLMNFMAGVFGMLATAFNILGAKRIGEGNKEQFRILFMSSILIDCIVGIVYGILSVIGCKVIYQQLYGLAGEALEIAIIYTRIMCLYMLVQMLIFTMNSYYKIKKNTSKLMSIAVLSTLINAILDYILIYGKFGMPQLGATGAAISSIVSVLFNMIVLIFQVRKELVFHISELLIYFKNIRVLIKESLPLIGEELLEGSIFIVVINAIISNIGIKEIGAYLLVKNILEIVMISMYMYGAAELTLVSEKCGEKRKNEIETLTFSGIFITEIIFVVISMLVFCGKNIIPRLISNDETLVIYASDIILPMIIMNLFNPIQVIYKYVLQALGEAKYVLYVTAIVNFLSLFCIFLLKENAFGMVSVFVGLFINYFIISMIYNRRTNKVINKLFDK
jgi:MATE efflux family protein